MTQVLHNSAVLRIRFTSTAQTVCPLLTTVALQGVLACCHGSVAYPAVIAPCRELHLATKYIWDDVFSAYIALKCSVTDNWHECIDRDIHSVA